MTRLDDSIKARARSMRKLGRSYGEIAKLLGVAKSTVSLWCRHIALSAEARKRLYTLQVEILSRGPKSSQARRQAEISEIIQQAKQEVSLPLSKESKKIAGAMLYWAEGSKTVDFNFTNSDPYLVLFMVNWMDEVFGIKPATLVAYLNIHTGQDELTIKKYWSKLTGIPINNFGKTFIKPEGVGFKQNNLYYGTIRIRAPKASNLRHQVFGWINAILSDLSPEMALKQKQWSRVSRARSSIGRATGS